MQRYISHVLGNGISVKWPRRGVGNLTAILMVQDLNDSMQSHLRLHFNNEEASDEQVCPNSSFACYHGNAHSSMLNIGSNCHNKAQNNKEQ